MISMNASMIQCTFPPNARQTIFVVKETDEDVNVFGLKAIFVGVSSLSTKTLVFLSCSAVDALLTLHRIFERSNSTQTTLQISTFSIQV